MVKKRTNPNREEDFQRYQLWRSIPRSWRNLGPGEIAKLGIENHQLTELFEIKTQNDYCKKYTIGINTLTRWNKRINGSPDSPLKGMERLAKEMMPTMYATFTMQTLKHGDAARTKLWMQLFARFNDRPSGKVKEKIVEKEFDVVGFIRKQTAEAAKERAELKRKGIIKESGNDVSEHATSSEQKPILVSDVPPIKSNPKKDWALIEKEIRETLKKVNQQYVRGAKKVRRSEK